MALKTTLTVWPLVNKGTLSLELSINIKPQQKTAQVSPMHTAFLTVESNRQNDFKDELWKRKNDFSLCCREQSPQRAWVLCVEEPLGVTGDSAQGLLYPWESSPCKAFMPLLKYYKKKIETESRRIQYWRSHRRLNQTPILHFSKGLK